MSIAGRICPAKASFSLPPPTGQWRQNRAQTLLNNVSVVGLTSYIHTYLRSRSAARVQDQVHQFFRYARFLDAMAPGWQLFHGLGPRFRRPLATRLGLTDGHGPQCPLSFFLLSRKEVTTDQDMRSLGSGDNPRASPVYVPIA